MPEDEKVSDGTDQPEAPPEGETPEDQPQAPETEAGTEGGEKPPTDEEARFTHATFTKLTQDYAARFRAQEERNRILEEKLDQVLAIRAENEPEPEMAANPLLEKALHGSKLVKTLTERNAALEKKSATLEQTVEHLARSAAAQAVAAQFPDLKDDMPAFLAWARDRVPVIQSGLMGDAEIVAAFRHSHPAKRASRPASGAAQVRPTKVETASRSPGQPKSLDAALAAKGITNPTFEDKIREAANRAEKKVAAEG